MCNMLHVPEVNCGHMADVGGSGTKDCTAFAGSKANGGILVLDIAASSNLLQDTRSQLGQRAKSLENGVFWIKALFSKQA